VRLYRIVSDYFVCGIVVREGVVIKTAPIMHYARGWSEAQLLTYCLKREWSVECS
jgi:hypothetical protein